MQGNKAVVNLKKKKYKNNYNLKHKLIKSKPKFKYEITL